MWDRSYTVQVLISQGDLWSLLLQTLRQRVFRSTCYEGHWHVQAMGVVRALSLPQGETSMPHWPVPTSFEGSVDLLELPKVKKDVRQEFADISAMGTNFPGGDVMYQSLWRKNGGDLNLWPKEERFYKGPRLGEYARPLVMNRNVLGYMNQAPVPVSPAEDELTLVAHASSAAKRARAHAEYAQQAAEKAQAFYKAAKSRARALFIPDPPISVKPTADVYPMYSAGPMAPMAASVSASLILAGCSDKGSSKSHSASRFLGLDSPR